MFRRRPPGSVPVRYERVETAMREWPKPVQRVRLAAFSNDGLYVGGPPCAYAGYGAWFVYARAERKLIGHALVVEDRTDTTRSILDEMAVLPEWQSLGVGRQLVTESVIWASERGAETMSLVPLAGPTHDQLEIWYRSLGFIEPYYYGLMAPVSDLVSRIGSSSQT